MTSSGVDPSALATSQSVSPGFAICIEIADEGMGTDRQIVVGALAAFEGYAVDEAFIVDYSDVAILYRTLHNYSSGVVFLLLL